MKRVLVDTSIWIAFFRGDDVARQLLPLLEAHQVCTNDLILSELLPSLHHRQEHRIIDRLTAIERLELKVVWSELIEMQVRNLKNGINKVGIPDLIIVQNALQSGVPILSLDKHFSLMKDLVGVEVYP